MSPPSGEGGPTAEILLSERIGLGDAGVALPYDHYPTYQHEQGEAMSSLIPSLPLIEDGSSQVLVKSHVAVYEINARWGSRLVMVLVALGGLFCAVSGGLCAEHHCRELQFCEDGHETHGNWCGPSGNIYIFINV